MVNREIAGYIVHDPIDQPNKILGWIRAMKRPFV
jgi:hypothetical protein